MDEKTNEHIGLEEGWSYILNEGILKVESFVNSRTPGSSQLSRFSIFNHTQYMELYHKVYTMCSQRSPFNWAEALRERHKMYVKGYLEGTVLPNLQLKYHGNASLLAEYAKRWANHKFMTKCLNGFFKHLNKYAYQKCLDTTDKVSMDLFKNKVYLSLIHI